MAMVMMAAGDEHTHRRETWKGLVGSTSGNGHTSSITNVHPESVCAGNYCVLHNPSDHHMRDWPAMFRSDKGFTERVCEHGIGHPDPDDLDWHVREGRAQLALHACDDCCNSRS